MMWITDQIPIRLTHSARYQLSQATEDAAREWIERNKAFTVRTNNPSFARHLERFLGKSIQVSHESPLLAHNNSCLYAYKTRSRILGLFGNDEWAYTIIECL